MIAIILGILIGLLNFFSEKISARFSHRSGKISSFAAGITTSYLFLELLPLLYVGIGAIKNFVFLLVLIGFSLFHAIELHIYHHQDREKLKLELKEIHSVGLFLYHFVSGIIIFELSRINPTLAVLFFVPVAINSLFSSLSLEKMHSHARLQKIIRVMLSLSAILGVLAASFYRIPAESFNSLLAITVGGMLYIIIRDHLPRDREEKVSYFLLGAFLYSAIILASWLFGK